MNISGSPKAVDASADTVRTAALAAGLGDAEMAQVEAMRAAAEHIRLAEETVARSEQVLEGDLDADARSTNLAEIFDARLGDAIKKMPEKTDRLADGRDYLALRIAEPCADGLSRWQTLTSPPRLQQSWQALRGN